MNEAVQRVLHLAEQWSAQDLLRWVSATFGREAEIASGFGAEGVVLIDIAAQVQPNVRVFTLDTEFLFPESYALMERVERRYGIAIERIKPELSSEDQELLHGPALWGHNPEACCNLRKVEPLRRKLSQLRAWITSIRRDQTPARASAPKAEWDEKFGLVKVNPLADWTNERVWQYIREHNVPYNPLHDQSYPSIGCRHCTRSIRPGEGPRAGRWSGFEKTECGLHVEVRPQIVRQQEERNGLRHPNTKAC
jgi:phosphoadenosine phosphosulfate reductase